MTEEQINAAIAREIWHFSLVWDALMGHEPNHCESRIQIKNYASDLNLMHKAEKSLSLDDRNHYIDALGATFGGSWDFATATARQRAEAFLRTLGKWEEVQK